MREVNDALYGEEIRLAEHEILSGKNVFFLELRWIHPSAMSPDSVTYFKLGLHFHEVSSLLYNTIPSERIGYKDIEGCGRRLNLIGVYSIAYCETYTSFC